MTFIFALYLGAALLLALYGAHTILLTLIHWHRRGKAAPSPPLMATPDVTIQLPIYNEAHVIQRLIGAVASLDWPRERLHVQVLDDSDDETTALAAASAEKWRRAGVDVTVLRRPTREGYKAGALAYGLATAKGEFIAIFDADFVPSPDFLRRTVPHLLADPGLGFIQTRWGHLNADESPLTRSQALALDGHFVVEQAARQAAGWFIGFNGTAGIWRRACIADAGGWRHDTLAEDLDLSYRAQLRGWRGRYLGDVVSPAEVPPQLAALKRQQSRWAQGSIQCLRLLAGPVWRSGRPLALRLAALLHLSGYLVHPLMLILLLTTLPLLWNDASARWPLAYMSLASLGPPLLYATAQRELYRRGRWLRRYAFLPVLVLVGTGVALSNARAVLHGLRAPGGTFKRTPKFRREGQRGGWLGQRYTLPLEGIVVGEILLALYALVAIGIATARAHYWAIPFLALYAAGFGLVAGLALWQARPVRSKRPIPLPPHPQPLFRKRERRVGKNPLPGGERVG
ncbi:MAG: glycosyltransferase [Anaerolineae bacterium]|nr:glycosyltransferase [Anaerolineae bacterium]